MSRARHKKASGGKVYYEGGESNVAKEAAEKQQKKHGGAVKNLGKIEGGKSRKRADRKASGGMIGSDKSPMAPGSARHPFSSAARGK